MVLQVLNLISSCQKYRKISTVNIYVQKVLFFPEFFSPKVSMWIIHKKWILTFFSSTCVTVFRMAWPKISYVDGSNYIMYNQTLLFIPQQGNNHRNACLFIICFFYYELLFAKKFVIFSCEHVLIFVMNTM